MFGMASICSYDNALCNGGGIGDTWYPLGSGNGGIVFTGGDTPITLPPVAPITNVQPTSTVATRDSTKKTESAASNGNCLDVTTGQRFTFNCFAAPCNCPPNSVSINPVTNTPTPTPTATNNILDLVKTNPLPTAIIIGALIWAVSKK